MMFKVGDAVVHRERGAGVVVGLEEMRRPEGTKQYYMIELLSQSSTSLMMPVRGAEKAGLRRAIPRSGLNQVWRVLRADPEKLPDDHKCRYRVLEEKLQGGDIIEIAEAVRDMARRRDENGLTGRGKRIHHRGLQLLAAEIAVAQGVSLGDAEAQVRNRLDKGGMPDLLS